MWWMVMISLARAGNCDETLEAWSNHDEITQKAEASIEPMVAEIERMAREDFATLPPERRTAVEQLLLRKAKEFRPLALDAFRQSYQLVLEADLGCEVLSSAPPWDDSLRERVEDTLVHYKDKPELVAKNRALLDSVLTPFMQQLQADVAATIDPSGNLAVKLKTQCEERKSNYITGTLRGLAPEPGSPDVARLAKTWQPVLTEQGLSDEAAEFISLRVSERAVTDTRPMAPAVDSMLKDQVDRVVSCDTMEGQVLMSDPKRVVAQMTPIIMETPEMQAHVEALDERTEHHLPEVFREAYQAGLIDKKTYKAFVKPKK